MPDPTTSQGPVGLAGAWTRHTLALAAHQDGSEPLGANQIRMHALAALRASHTLTARLAAWLPTLAVAALDTGASHEQVIAHTALTEPDALTWLLRDWADEQLATDRITPQRHAEIHRLATGAGGDHDD